MSQYLIESYIGTVENELSISLDDLLEKFHTS